MKTILIIEKDNNLKEAISYILNKKSFKTIHSYNLDTVENIFNRSKIDMVILDIVFNSDAEFKFCMEIKSKYYVPVLILTSYKDVKYRSLIKNSIIDNYLLKPFSMKEFIDKVMLYIDYEKGILKCDEFKFDFNNKSIVKNNKSIYLNDKEYKLLNYLLDNACNIVFKEDVIKDYDEHCIFSLIRKIEEDTSNPKYIKSIYGIGYSWCKSFY